MNHLTDNHVLQNYQQSKGKFPSGLLSQPRHSLCPGHVITGLRAEAVASKKCLLFNCVISVYQPREDSAGIFSFGEGLSLGGGGLPPPESFVFQPLGARIQSEYSPSERFGVRGGEGPGAPLKSFVFQIPGARIQPEYFPSGRVCSGGVQAPLGSIVFQPP